MPRANRHFLADHVWHITHRCHKKEFLLKFAKDHQRRRHWLYEAKKRYGLSVLNWLFPAVLLRGHKPLRAFKGSEYLNLIFLSSSHRKSKRKQTRYKNSSW